MTLTIELSDEQRTAAWKAKAASQSLTVEAAWLRKLADDDASTGPSPDATRQKKQAAASRILELQKNVRPDPEGWTIRDYINYGRR